MINDKDTEEKQDSMDLSAEERAIIEKQIREDELSHTPNEGDPIRDDI